MTDYTPKHALDVQTDERLVLAETPALPANAGVPTQVANPSRASWRTFVQTVIPFLIALNAFLPIAKAFLETNITDAQSVLGPVYGWIVIGVNVGVVVFSLGAKLIAVTMANPIVNEWIKAHLSFLAPIPLDK